MRDTKPSLALTALQNFQPSVNEAHKPEICCITCIDGREGAGRYFDFGDQAIRITEIASVIPPYDQAPAGLRAKFSFTKLKNISTIKIVGHSFCGGAETVIGNPDIDAIENPEIRDIVYSLAQSGADLPRLKDAFLRAVEGNKTHAANLLSRHLVLQSLANVSAYPYIDRQMRERHLDMIPLYHVMKQGTGQESHMERFDVENGLWQRTDQAPATHLCGRPFNCAACTSCHGTIQNALEWTPVEYATDDAGAGMTQVPRHIATLLRQRRSFFQPRLSAMAVPLTPAGTNRSPRLSAL